MAMAFSPAAQAVDWRFEPTLTASATYTDNVNQSASNTQDALILSATPGFTLNSEGSRQVKATLQYGLTGVARFGGDQNDNLYHNLNAVGKAELVEDFLFVDGNARVSQELISLLGSTADASVNDSNRATVGTYSISPYIQKRLGTFANVQARYTNSGAIFESDVANNSKVNAFTAGLSSGTRFNDLSWGLNYSIRKAQNSNAADTTLERANAMVGYALTRKFRVFGTVGQEWNDFLSTTNTDGSSWSAGFGWSPTRRTSIEASAGERFFGNTYSISGTHRTRSSQWSVRYYEDVNDFSEQLLAEANKVYWRCPNIPGGKIFVTYGPTPPAGEANCSPPVSIGLLRLAGVTDAELAAVDAEVSLSRAITNGIYVIKGLTAGVTWNLGRLDFGLSARDIKRLYALLGDAQDRTQGLIGSVSYRVSPRTTASSSLSFTRNSLDSAVTGGAAREDDIISLSLGLNHRFTDKFNGALTFRHTQRDSNLASSDYDENSLMATVNMRF